MKKLINRPGAVVEEMVEGLVAIYPGLARIPGQTVLVRADLLEADAGADNPEVAIISGGGSGHEPAHGGYVGRGMLAAAVAGDVFTSPSPDAVLAAIRAVTGPPGALLVVKNYTGDRLNFGLAAELARAEGLRVEVVVVADDVALPDGGSGLAGRRGLAGTVLVHKVAGAAAAAGCDLDAVLAEARATAEAVGTMGVALSACTVPAVGKPGFTLGDDEIELGLGIHGEPGVSKGPLEPADQLVGRLLVPIVVETRMDPGTRVALLVNNLGGTPWMELAVVARRAVADLEGAGLVVERVYAGTFLSALEMAGVSLSVLKLDDHRVARLDAPTDAPAWPNQAAVNRPRPERGRDPEGDPEPTGDFPAAVGLPKTALGQRFEVALMAATGALTSASARLTELDRVVGDGDLGVSLARGAKAVRDALGTFPPDDPVAALSAVGRTLQSSLGGTSGPLYAIFFLRASARLKQASANAWTDPTLWAEAFRSGCDGVAELGGASRGDRTMLDALGPASDAFSAALDAGRTWPESLALAVEAATLGAAATAAMTPRRGRSSYFGVRAIGHPDPGAEAVVAWLQAVARALR